MRRRVASLLLTLLICQSALAGAIEIRLCDQALQTAHAPMLLGVATDHCGSHDTSRDHDQPESGDHHGCCSCACVMVSGAPTSSASAVPQLPSAASESSSASAASSLYRPPAFS